METVGAYEAKTHLSELLERVKNGEQITITKHGVPVAILKPIQEHRNSKIIDVIADIKKFRKNYSTGGDSLKEMIAEGRC